MDPDHSLPDTERHGLLGANRLRPFVLLARLDRPIGWWLLFWPCAWGIALAGGVISHFGLILWLLLHALGVWQMERIRWRFGRREGGNKAWQWGLANALQQSQIVYLVGALFVGIAYQPFIFMLVGLQCALWSYVQRTETAPRKARFKRTGEALPAAG